MSGNLGLCLPNMLPSNGDKPLRWTDEMCEERMSKDNVLQNRIKIKNVLKKGGKTSPTWSSTTTQHHNIAHIPSFLAGKSKLHNLPLFTVPLAFFCFGHIMSLQKKHANASKVAPQMPQHANEKNTQKTVQCHVHTKKYDYILYTVTCCTTPA